MRGFSDIWTELSSILPSPPSYRGSSWNEKPGKAGTRSGSGWLPRTWSRVQILLSCSPLARPPTHRLQVANRFFAAQEGPGGEDSSGEKKIPAGGAMKRKLLDEEWGHGGVYTRIFWQWQTLQIPRRKEWHRRSRGILSAGCQPKENFNQPLLYCIYLMLQNVLLEETGQWALLPC